MYSVVKTGRTVGMDGHLVNVEVDVSNGFPAFEIVGLADEAVKESRERVKAAIKNSGFRFPSRRIIVNLAPADEKKTGAHYDLPIALGILASSGQINNMEILGQTAFVGELSLDGKIRAINGVLVIAEKIDQDQEIDEFFVPSGNAREAAVISNLRVIAGDHLQEIVAMLEGEKERIIIENLSELFVDPDRISDLDMRDVKGQENTKRALEIAAAGAHNILMVGPPGSGKTMIAKRLSTILPPLTLKESIEVTKIYSISGLMNEKACLIRERPFRSPHHTSSSVSLIGGGRIPKPGEITLSHHGILFLDEFAEFPRNFLEALRQPLEDRMVHISRVEAALTYPANFQLIGSMNPCPCG